MLILEMHTDNEISMNLIASRDSLQTIMFKKSEFNSFMVAFDKRRAKI